MTGRLEDAKVREADLEEEEAQLQERYETML